MKLIKFWQRKRVEQQRLILISVACALLGSVFGWGAGQVYGSKQGVAKKDVAREKSQIELIKNIRPASSNNFLLKKSRFGRPFLFNSNVVYLKSKNDATIEKIIKSPTLIEASGSKKEMVNLLKSFNPVQKVAQGAYFNKQRGAFIWLRSRQGRFYLIYSKNINSYPGDLK
jgi:hypothetical protein